MMTLEDVAIDQDTYFTWVKSMIKIKARSKIATKNESDWIE